MKVQDVKVRLNVVLDSIAAGRLESVKKSALVRNSGIAKALKTVALIQRPVPGNALVQSSGIAMLDCNAANKPNYAKPIVNAPWTGTAFLGKSAAQRQINASSTVMLQNPNHGTSKS